MIETGPWSIECHPGRAFVVDRCGAKVCACVGPDAETKARCIASLPVLLVMCKTAAALLDFGEAPPEYSSVTLSIESVQEVRARLRNAIAEAEPDQA